MIPHDESNIKQIRRPFNDVLDCLPNYPTITLLMGVCHVVRYDDYKVKTKTAAKKAHDLSLEKRRLDAKAHLGTHFETIKRMLEARATNREIAEAIEVSETTLARRLGESEELLRLALARPGYGPDSPTARNKRKRQTETETA